MAVFTLTEVGLYNFSELSPVMQTPQRRIYALVATELSVNHRLPDLVVGEPEPWASRHTLCLS